MTRIGYVRLGVVLAIGVATWGAAAPSSAEELLMGNRPWGFKAQNRAGIAAMMVQQDNGTLGGGTSGTVAAGNSCGGSGGTSSATANYTCIILGDGTTADISALQDALGDQAATSETQATANGVPENQLSSVLESLTN